MYSVKPFKSKNRDKIYLDAPNQNLKKVVIEIIERQSNLQAIVYFIGWKVSYSSDKILPMKFYSSSLELFIQ